MATAIPTTYVNGDVPTAAQFNAPGKALAGMGISTDNDAKPILPLSLDPPFVIPLPGAVQFKPIPTNSTYTVTSGKLLYVQVMAGAGTVTLTPLGGSAISVTLHSTAPISPARFCLMAGDQIALSASVWAAGLLLDVPALPSTPTRVLVAVTNSAAYTVPNNSAFIWTAAIPAGGNLSIPLTVDGVQIPPATNPSYASAPYGSWQPTVVGANQIIGSANTNPVLISGLVYSA